MDNKKNNYFTIKALFISFILFLIIYFSKENGYYEYKMFLKSRLVDEKIEEFESDIKEGKDVSNEEYLKDTYVDYSNKISDLGYNVSYYMEEFMNKGIKKTLEIFGKLF